jgi:hypothetical protein
MAFAETKQKKHHSDQNKLVEKTKAQTKSFDFESDEIQGELPSFSQFRLTVKEGAEHTSLIKIRSHFLQEIVKQGDDL